MRIRAERTLRGQLTIAPRAAGPCWEGGDRRHFAHGNVASVVGALLKTAVQPDGSGGKKQMTLVKNKACVTIPRACTMRLSIPTYREKDGSGSSSCRGGPKRTPCTA